MRPDRFAPLPPGDAEELLRGVTAHDEARALSLAFVPDSARAAALTACAFVAEAAAIPARVTDPMIGAIRVQWWREALDEAFGGGTVRAHPLVQAVASVLKPDLRASLEAVLDAMPPFFEGGGGVPLDLLRPTDGAMGALVARIAGAGADEAAKAGEASAVAAWARIAAVPPPPARSPQIETPRQRAARRLAAESMDVRAAVAEARSAWSESTGAGAVLGGLPFALARAHAEGREPGPLRTRLAMTRMVALGRP